MLGGESFLEGILDNIIIRKTEWTNGLGSVLTRLDWE
jgi:hypothetical protein